MRRGKKERCNFCPRWIVSHFMEHHVRTKHPDAVLTPKETLDVEPRAVENHAGPAEIERYFARFFTAGYTAAKLEEAAVMADEPPLEFTSGVLEILRSRRTRAAHTVRRMRGETA